MAQSHYIHRLKLEVAAPTATDGFALQRALSQRFWEAIAPLLSDLFDQFSYPDEVIRIDRLDIELDRLSLSDWQTELPPSVYQALRDALEQILSLSVATPHTLFEKTNLRRTPLRQTQFEAWLYFLETGQMPETASLEGDWRQAALASVAAESKSVDILRGLFLQKPLVIERLVLQHDEPFLIQLAEAITGRKQTDLADLRKGLVALLRADFFNQILKNAKAAPRIYDLVEARRLEVLVWENIFSDLAKSPERIDFQFFVKTFLKTFYEKIPQETVVFILKSLSKNRFTPPSVFLEKKGVETKTVESEIRSVSTEGLDIADEAQNWFKTSSNRTDISEAISQFFEQAIKTHQAAILSIEMPTKKVVKPTNVSADRQNLEKPKNPTDDKYQGAGNASIEKTSLRVAEPSQDDAAESPNRRDRSDRNPTGIFGVEEEKMDLGNKNLIAPHVGILLLHPFLSPFFESLDLLKSNRFVDLKAQKRAAALLHYLATGKTDMAEYDMLMPKIMVGLPLQTPLDRRIELTEAEKHEAEKLLTIVINYWESLGNTSPGGLREGFLQRAGKLSRRDDGWLIKVETKTIDILLDRLPWGFGIIRLSWMTDMLFVEWY
jgi:hypothetical protein